MEPDYYDRYDNYEPDFWMLDEAMALEREREEHLHAVEDRVRELELEVQRLRRPTKIVTACARCRTIQKAPTTDDRQTELPFPDDE